MKTVQINFIANSLKAREILFTNKLIPAKRKSSVAKWLESASDDEIKDLAVESGWTEETIITSKDIKTDVPVGVEATDMTVTDSKGQTIVVPVYNLPFVKTRVEDIYKGGVKTGRKTKAFIFQFGDKTIKTYSNLLAEARKAGELHKGDIIPFNAETCKPEHVPAKNGNDAYFFWVGGTFEAGCETLQDARELREEREEEFASKSKEGQERILELTADAEAKAYLDKYVH